MTERSSGPVTRVSSASKASVSRGGVTIGNGRATLSEDAAFNSSLSQQLRIPQGARFLSFELSDVQFGTGLQTGVGDAFEIALVDFDNGVSLFGPIGLSRTNAAINIQHIDGDQA